MNDILKFSGKQLRIACLAPELMLGITDEQEVEVEEIGGSIYATWLDSESSLSCAIPLSLDELGRLMHPECKVELYLH